MAGGTSEAKLRLATLDQARKNARREKAIVRAKRDLAEAIELRDKANLEVQSAESRVRALEEEPKSGLDRQAYLAAQQAAETRPQAERDMVRETFEALRNMGSTLPQELQQQLQQRIGVLDQLLANFYPPEHQVEALVSQTGLGVDSDTDVSNGTDTEADDEPEVTGAILVERREARKEHRRLRNERGAELRASIPSGRSTVQEIAAKYSESIGKAAASAKKSEDQLRSAREVARARLRQRKAEELQQQQQQQRQQQQRADEDELVPCPPPPKWRRGEDGDASDATIDETLVIGGLVPAEVGPPTVPSTLAAAAAAPTAAAAAAAAAPAAASGAAPSAGLAARGTPETPTPAPLSTIIADCAVQAAQRATRTRAGSSERRRTAPDRGAQRGLVEIMAARWNKGRPSSCGAADGRGPSTARRGCEENYRSKSPRRPKRTTAEMEE